MFYGIAVVVVQHIADAARRGAFHHLERAPRIERIERPFTGGSLPVELAVGIHPRGQIDPFAFVADGLQRFERRHLSLFSIGRTQGLGQPFAAPKRPFFEDVFLGAFVRRNPRPAERPARAVAHVDLDA